jgi:hypothetical protein
VALDGRFRPPSPWTPQLMKLLGFSYPDDGR